MKHQIVFISFLFSFLIGCAHVAEKPPSSLADQSFHQLQNPPASAEASTMSADTDKEVTADQTGDSDVSDDDDYEDEDELSVPDPLSLWNKGMFHFNDKFYFWILKPVTKAYKTVVPELARIGVSNFFTNLTTPIRLTNCILQGKWKSAHAEIDRFLLNSIFGIFGFGNPAKRYPRLKPSEEDLGQTLGAYGIGEGIYIVWPFLGPSTLRDSIGLLGDSFINPLSYIEPTEAAIGIYGYRIVNDTSFRLGDYESLKEAAIDPYEALRDAYIQHRKSKVEK